jgi:hypothetical protein
VYHNQLKSMPAEEVYTEKLKKKKFISKNQKWSHTPKDINKSNIFALKNKKVCDSDMVAI